jgi:hypothetical protein
MTYLRREVNLSDGLDLSLAMVFLILGVDSRCGPLFIMETGGLSAVEINAAGHVRRSSLFNMRCTRKLGHAQSYGQQELD